MKNTNVLTALVFGFLLYSCKEVEQTIVSSSLNKGIRDKVEQTIVLSSQNKGIEDVYINSAFPDSNWDSTQSIIVAAWTYGGIPGVGVTLFKVDFSLMPKDVELLSATLDLYHDPSSGHVGHSTRSGSNSALLQKLSSGWEPESVTWNSLPSSLERSQILLAESTTAFENYLDIDVFSLINDLIRRRNENFGFLLKPVIETPYRSLVFASVDHPMSELHPTLTITFLTSSNLNGITQP